ncbi:hypothetical protein VTO42DRAFT_85 [Malbranchea cinnamomea]
METAIRWSPTSTPDDQRFLYVDVSGRSLRLCKAIPSRKPRLEYDVLYSRSDVPAFRAFDWSPVDEALVAVGQSSGEATVFRLSEDSSNPIVFPARNQRYCNAVAFSSQGLLAAGLDKVRNDFCLNIWDLNQQRRVDKQPVEPLRKFASSESITSIKFFKSQPETLVAGVKGQYVRIYDLREGTSAPSLQFSTRCVHNLAIDWLDENYIASCFPQNDASICIWDRRSGSRYPITAVSSAADTSHLSAALEFRRPIDPKASIWSLRFSRVKRGCLGMLASNGNFKVYELAKEYISEEHRMSLEHTFGQDTANSPEPIYTRNIRDFRSHSLLRQEAASSNEARVAAFDFMNFNVSNRLSAVTLLADRTVSTSHLPPTVPCPMDISSKGALARGVFTGGDPIVKISAPSFPPGTRVSQIVQDIQRSRAMRNAPQDVSTKADGKQDDSRQADETDTSCLSSREKREKLISMEARLEFRDALAWLTIPQLRCKEGYLLDSARNKTVVSDDSALQNLWDWIGSARARSAKGTMIVRGVDMNYIGIYNVWNGNLGQSFENRFASSDLKQKSVNVSALFRELTHAANIPKAKGCSSKFPEQRQLCLRICGAKESIQDLEKAVDELVAHRQHTKAAALAIFQDERKLAYRTLRQNEPTQAHKTLAMAIIGSSNGATSSDWEETCAEIAKELTDPYARAILALVSKGDWHSVIDEATLPLRYRVEVALRWLPDDELTSYLRRATIEAIQQGDVEGVVLTGLDHAAMDLFQSYINKFNDVQTPVLAMSHTVPRFISDTENRTRFEAWCKTYRSGMNSWKMHLNRAKFDVETSKLAATWDGRRLVKPPPQQISLVCNYCTRPLSQRDNMDSAGPETVHLTTGNPLGPATMTGTVCPKCGRHMPRCGICSLWLGSPDPMSRASIAGDAKKESSSNHNNNNHNNNSGNRPDIDDVMRRFVMFCIHCNHGFHADHARAWFAKHRICPVAECNCICDR